MLRPQRAAAGGAYRQRSGEEFKYQYDLNNRVTSSSAGDQWEYDNLGNVLEHRWRSGQDRFTINEYDAAEREGWDSLGPRTKAAASANIAADLSSDLSAGSVITLSPYLLVMDASDETTLRTDYAFQRIGGRDGLSSGAVQYHTVEGGESLRALAHIYYGSPSYWYLIADANGLSGDEPVEAGRVLTIPGVIANSVNDKDTYKVYSESAIIGAESPAAKVKKKSSFMQKLMMVIIIVVIVVMAYFTAGWAATAYGTIAASGTVAAVAAGLVVAAAIGYAAGYATAYLTQTLAIAAGLQEGYDWKAMQKMGTSFAVSAVGGVATAWANQASTAWGAVARASVAGAQQYATEGKITSWSGILMAAMPGGDNANSSTLQKIDAHRGTIGAGLSLIEASARGDQDGMHWVDFAAAAIGNGVASESGSGYYSSEGFNWSRIATETVINIGMAAVVGSRYGTEAGLNFFGGALGQTVAGMTMSRQSWHTQVDQLTAAGASSEQAPEGEMPPGAAAGTGADPQRHELYAGPGGTLVDASGNPVELPAMFASSGQIGTDAIVDDSTGSGQDHYIVGEGDSFWRIAARELGEGATDAQIQQRTQELMEANPGVDPRALRAGDQLQVPPSGIEVSGDTVEAFARDAALNVSSASNRSTTNIEPASVQSEHGVLSFGADPSSSLSPGNAPTSISAFNDRELSGSIHDPRATDRFVTRGRNGNNYYDTGTKRSASSPFRQQQKDFDFGYGLSVDAGGTLVGYHRSHEALGITFEHGATISGGLAVDRSGLSAKSQAGFIAQTQYMDESIELSLGTVSSTAQTVGHVEAGGAFVFGSNRTFEASAQGKAQAVAIQYAADYESDRISVFGGVFDISVKARAEGNVVGVGGMAQLGVKQHAPNRWNVTAGVGLTALIGGNLKTSLDISYNPEALWGRGGE